MLINVYYILFDFNDEYLYLCNQSSKNRKNYKKIVNMV